MGWSRPTNVQYPNTWLKFESNKTKGLKFTVKDLTREYYDITLGYLTNMLLKESAISGPLDIISDYDARTQMQQTWLTIMDSKMAMICVTDDSELPRVAGIHVTMVRERHNENGNKKLSETYSKFAKIVEEMKDAGQMFNRIGGDYYLGSLGLLVLPEFRGHGIATQMLKAREYMCRSLGLRGTATVFSTAAAQAAASSAGYKVFAEKKIEDIQTRHGVTVAHDLKIMGIVFGDVK